MSTGSGVGLGIGFDRFQTRDAVIVRCMLYLHKVQNGSL